MTTATPTPASASTLAGVDCYHCGLPCPDQAVKAGEHAFCCTGCRAVFDILQDNGLQQYYRLQASPGTQQQQRDHRDDRFAYLDDPAMASLLVEFDDGRLARATLSLPQIHCASCVWLLENLGRLEPAVRTAEVDLLRRELSVSWDRTQRSLRQVVECLAAIGYEPDITLQAADAQRAVDDPLVRRVGVAGFCFGNIMLFSLPEYLAQAEPLSIQWQQLFAGLNLLLSLPVLLYCAHPFLNGAWQALRRAGVTIDVPIALGIIVLFGRSAVDILAGTGPGYMDSFAGLVFFLLLGRLFQRHSFAALNFERDYRSYFPLSVTLRDDGQDRPIAVADLQPGHRIVAHQGELVPADSRLLSHHGCIDFSYVTGESQPVEAERGDTIWAGGRAVGAAVELEVLRDVSQGYLTRLWNQDETAGATARTHEQDLAGLSNRIAMLFTVAVLAIATTTGVAWLVLDAGIAAHAVSSVLIIACPCALALSAPFTTGTALNLLARSGLFLRHGSVVERLAQIQSIVFDKTGTLAVTQDSEVNYDGELLSPAQQQALASLLAQSVHPLSRTIRSCLPSQPPLQVADYDERPGLGLAGTVDGTALCAGSRTWLRSNGISAAGTADQETRVHVGFDGRYVGSFTLGNAYRDGIQQMLADLRRRWSLHLLSGDNDSERQRLLPWFGGDNGRLHFDQSPAAKLQFVKDLGQQQRVLMVGDGLNDAGALDHSHAGLAVTEDVATFSPASDGFLQADQLRRLPAVLRFSRACVHIIAASMALSVAYNVTGLSFAVRGELSPLVSAVLMPVSSVTVIAFTVIATRLAARRFGIGRA